jgi:CheY-like chemotaxis protein
MDIQLPLLDGYEATRRIKADPVLKHIPIIVVTSYALSGDEAKARAAGCDAYMAKPFSRSPKSVNIPHEFFMACPQCDTGQRFPGGSQGHAPRDHRPAQPGDQCGLADPKLKARFAELSAAVLPGSPADFGKLLVDETEKWAKVVKFSGASAD